MTSSLLPQVRALMAQGMGNRRIAAELSISKHQALTLMGKARLEEARALVPAGDFALSHYDIARRALSEARTLQEVEELGNKSAAIQEYARRAKDRALEIDAAEIRIRALRRYGEMIAHVKETTGLSKGGRPPAEETGGTTPPVSEPAPTLADIGADKELSRRSQKLAKVAEGEFEQHVSSWRDTMQAEKRVSLDVLKAPINGARSVMASRNEPDDSLDFFPTPPWATRALMERVLPRLREVGLPSVWEPACGEGHIAEVLKEYCTNVSATDVHDYGYGQIEDFLGMDITGYLPDWIITNPPFGDKSIPFVLRALSLARVGVAMFFRSQWAVEGVDRYEQIFRDHPPTLFAPFVERVNLCKGRWDPVGSTATAYCWLVWVKAAHPRPPFWIPPGCRESLTRPDDKERFTAHPVKRRESEAQPPTSQASDRGASAGPLVAGAPHLSGEEGFPDMPMACRRNEGQRKEDLVQG